MEPWTRTSALVKTFVALIEEKDVYLRGHAERVAATCFLLAKKLGMEKAGAETLSLAALLHDIGMMFLPVELLHKAAPLSANERSLVQQHPAVAERILAHLEPLREALPIIRHHHEAFDGSGYPDGLRGVGIPLGARILHIADAYQAMTAPRPHRAAKTGEEALREIGQLAGRLYDPELTAPLADIIRTHSSYTKQPPQPSGGTPEVLTTAITEIMLRFRKEDITLPVLPQVIHEAKRITSNPEAGAAELANAIEKDAVISFRLIGIANSPAYRGTDRIHSVQQAVRRLGDTETGNIITAIAAKNIFSAHHHRFTLLLEKMWLHSLACAYASREIARLLRVPDPEKYFLLGMLHDIGKPLLINALAETVTDSEALETAAVVRAIDEVHCRFGSILLLRWGFPRDCIKAAELHDESAFAPQTAREVLVIATANMLTRTIGYSLFEQTELDVAHLPAAGLLGMTDADWAQVQQAVQTVMQSSANCL